MPTGSRQFRAEQAAGGSPQYRIVPASTNARSARERTGGPAALMRATRMSVKRYLLSLPERVVRSAVGVGAGVLREVGEVAIPAGIRRSQLYQTSSMSRFAI